MKTRIPLRFASIVFAAALTACAGAPVNLGPHPYTPPPAGTARTVEGKSCGFQLLLLIPIAINDRQERAYNQLLAQAGGDYVTDIAWKDEWFYGLVGTGYCTTLTGTAIRAAAVAPVAVPPAPAAPQQPEVTPTPAPAPTSQSSVAPAQAVPSSSAPADPAPATAPAPPAVTPVPASSAPST